jgi:hypothetical protein
MKCLLHPITSAKKSANESVQDPAKFGLGYDFLLRLQGTRVEQFSPAAFYRFPNCLQRISTPRRERAGTGFKRLAFSAKAQG